MTGWTCSMPPLMPDTPLRAAIVRKNQLWFDAWRPANWSFVYGDRVNQMFGKAGGTEPSLKSAFERHRPLVDSADREIHALAKGAPVSKPAFADAPKLSSRRIGVRRSGA